MFWYHNLVIYNGIYYDPSYGSYTGSAPYNAANPPFVSLAAWEDHSINALAIEFPFNASDFLWIKNINQTNINDLDQVTITYY